MEESNKKRIAIIGADHSAKITSLLAAAGDVEIVDINNIPEDYGLLYTKEAEYQMETLNKNGIMNNEKNLDNPQNPKWDIARVSNWRLY